MDVVRMMWPELLLILNNGNAGYGHCTTTTVINSQNVGMLCSFLTRARSVNEDPTE